MASDHAREYSRAVRRWERGALPRFSVLNQQWFPGVGAGQAGVVLVGPAKSKVGYTGSNPVATIRLAPAQSGDGGVTYR